MSKNSYSFKHNFKHTLMKLNNHFTRINRNGKYELYTIITRNYKHVAHSFLFVKNVRTM